MTNNTTQTAPKGFGITALVLGIVSILGLLFFYPLGVLAGVVGIVFGILALRRNAQNRGVSITGLVLSSVGALLSILLWIITAVAVAMS